MIDNIIKNRNLKVQLTDRIPNIRSLTLCAERMTGMYEYFTKEVRLDFKWYPKEIEFLLKADTFTEHKLAERVAFIEEKIPDSEDYPELWATQGQCAVLCLIKIYDYIKTDNKDNLLAGYDFMDNAIDLYLQEATETEKEIEKTVNSLFISELNWQIEIMNRKAEPIGEIRKENLKRIIPPYPELFSN